VELASTAPPDEQLVMVKSWNEWAEGNYLEPDTEFGPARLEALAREVRLAQRGGASVGPVPGPDVGRRARRATSL